ncbi:AfsR/SARP family transcriptional regulator [Nonomuraea aridisoli]|uniref:SARP family transcriptional regulator n=1 Tax=Nonomuraea aridisoli TaxID=2070368 RepID=A0A2W2DVQ9_9ACTN|nr:AfsR/SARP family transcriptional regulator [Nonomuraea aridisoli]PZG15966.1 SARP family transcriptional regulator [Nonomuraea aridisoli]
MLSFGVLGPLTAEDERGPVSLKGPRHRAVLARLLVARARVVPVSWLVADLWDDPPEGAVGAVQTFVGALRKALEPSRPPRTPSRLLVTAPPGYALRAEPEAVDAWRFEAAVAESARLLDGGAAPEALALLDEALGWWRGPAYAEFAELDWARGEAVRLDELRRLAVERRAEAALACGHAAEAVPDLEAHVAAHPLREDGWRLLALALYRTGRQSDALATLRRARETLRTEVGVDPGAGLRRLESDILAHAPHLTPEKAGPPAQPFVGRVAELGELEGVAADVAHAGRSRLVLLSGEAGAGKTALTDALLRRLAARGWTVARGASPELPGAPAAWPWSRISEQLAGRPPAEEEGERFGRHRRICAYLRDLAARRPVSLVFDDLHWADEETLALVTTLAGELGPAPVLVVATYRSTEISAALAEALGRAARHEPGRVYLGGLAEPQVGELAQALTGRAVPPGDVRTIHARTGGNPFFVRELVRVWESGGGAALRGVPAGVRDVIRHRLAALPETARTHMRQAAVVGQEVDLDVLVPLAGDEEGVLDSVESALLAGFLVDSGGLRFAHALVHETLYQDVPRPRRARWHARAAEIAERVRPGDVETVAHHCLRAEGAADPRRTARSARAAAERAERRSAPHDAARLWRETVAALDRLPGADPLARLEAVMGLVRALAVTGRLPEARRHRAEAARAAEALGDPVRTAIGAELLDLAAGHDELAAFEVLGHLIQMQARAALADLDAADRHAAAADRLAERYDLPLVGVFTTWYAALRHAVSGRVEQARAAYRAAAARLSGTGMPGVEDGLLPLALLCLGDDPEPDGGWGPYEKWALPVVLLRRGRPDEAAARAIPESPRDLLFEARACLHAMAAIEAGDRPAMERLYELLLPAEGELAGAGSGLVTLGPVALYLGHLATALGRPGAAAHYRRAEQLV